MKLKTFPSTWLDEADSRLDCSPYLSGAVEARVILDDLKFEKQRLVDLTANGQDGIFHAGRVPRTWVVNSEFGTPFLSSSDILRSDVSNVALIANSIVEGHGRLRLEKGWTLITRSGTIGRMAFCRDDLKKACTEDVLRIVPDAEAVHPGFLYAYLRSKFGIPLVLAGTYGAVIKHIEPEHVVNLPVPRLGFNLEKRIGEVITASEELMTQYSQSVREATGEYFCACGLEDITRDDWHGWGRDLGFSQKFPAKDSLRTLNYAPRFRRLKETIHASGSWKRVGDLTIDGTLRSGPRFKRIDASGEHAIKLLGQRALFQLNPEGRMIAKAMIPDGVIMEPGTCLVAAHGTFGETEVYCRAEFVWGPWAEYAYSQDMLRVIADPEFILPGALFSFLRSETAFRMFRAASTGTKLQEFHYQVMPDIPVPYPEESVRAEIHEKVVAAYEKRHKAVALEEEAVKMVEEAIERN